jgi:RNA polymerase sigma-B factor
MSSPGHGSGAGRERLIESHLPLVRAIARRYTGRGESLEDLIQVGSVALVRASDRFDPSRGVSFAAFATPAVEGEIRRHLGDQTGSLRIPRQLRQMTGELERSRSRLAATLGREPTVAELAEALGVEQVDVERALEAEQARGSAPALSEDALEAGADAESLEASDDRLLLEKSAHVLNERERRIVFLRFHADLTEREISREVGISQAQVSRSLTKALAKLREELDREPISANTGDTTKNPVVSATQSASQPIFHKSTGRKRPGSEDAETKIGTVAALEEEAHRTRPSGPVRDQDPASPYHVTVKPGGEDQASPWIASVDELAGCEAGGATPDEAVENLRAAMETWLSAAAEGRRVVRPQKRGGSRRKRASAPSGRFLVRMPSDLHEELTRAAEREEVSLNRFVTEQLAASVAASPSTRTPEPEPRETDGAPAAAHGRRGNLQVLLAANVLVMVIAAGAAIALLIAALERGI